MLTQVYLNNNLRLFSVILEFLKKEGSSVVIHFPETYMLMQNVLEIGILQIPDVAHPHRLPTWH